MPVRKGYDQSRKMTFRSEKVREPGPMSRGTGIIADYTGFFVSWEKSHVLINTIQDVLRNKFKTYAKIGSRLPNNTAEIVLYSQQSSGANISGAKHLLESYLKMIQESRPCIFEKKVEVIELDDDENIPSIVLDDSINESISVLPNNSVTTGTNSQQDQSKNSAREIRSLSQNVFTQDKQSSVSQFVNGTSCDHPSSGMANATKGLKRKHSFVDDDDVVEILDDDVIILDDSFSSETNNLNKAIVNNNSCLENCEQLIDLTESSSSLSNKVEFNNKLDQINNSNSNLLHRTHEVLNIPCTSNPSSALYLQTTTTKIECPSIESTSKPSSSPNHLLTDTGIGNLSITNKKLLTNKSTTETSSNKVSKLSYKRPAHLIIPLTVSSNSPSIVDSQSNIYNPHADSEEKKTGLRPIVIDGNNVAIGHGKGQFSLKGLEICINYFEKRGHRQIKAFVPHYRTNRDTFEGLRRLERQGTVVVTPSRKVDGKVVASYDDRFIVQYASEFGGVIVSSDNFRDLMKENPSWKETIEKRLLMFTWVDDLLMFPQDPLGRNGPTLDEFLKFPDS